MANTMSAYGSNTNRPLSEIVGLSTDTKPTDSIEGIQIQNGSSFRELDTGKRFLFDAENTTWNEVSSGGGGGGSTLIEKSISANGVYNASEDSADGYSKVTVDVPNTYTAEDEGKVVDNGALVAQTTHAEITENGTYDITTNNSVSVNVSGGGVEFSNSPAAFKLLTNIRNLNVIVPSGVTSLSSYAFNSCTGLKSITIPSSVTSIEENTFDSCTGLTSITIPSGVTSIGNNAFKNCTGLESIDLPDSLTIIGGGAFSNCTSLQSIKFASINPPTVNNNTTFRGVPTTCIIYVPTGSLSAYTSAQYYPDSNTYTYVEY